MEVNGDPDKSCHILMGKGRALIDESGCRECGEYLYYSYFFCEFEIIFKMFKTGSDKKESKDTDNI